MARMPPITMTRTAEGVYRSADSKYTLRIVDHPYAHWQVLDASGDPIADPLKHNLLTRFDLKESK
jgi:hypothetical protein